MEYKETLEAKKDDIIVLDSNWVKITKITFYDIDGDKVDTLMSHEKHSFEVPNLKGEYFVLIDTISERGTAWYSLKLKIN